MNSSMVCPHCKSTKVVHRGTLPRQRYQCVDPKHPEDKPRYFYGERSPAKVLVFDIETLPGIKRFWRLGEEDWNIETIISNWIVLGYSGKWLFQPEVMSGILTPKEALHRDDKRIVGEIWQLLNQADIVIAHNGDHFDMPNMNTRFLYHHLLVPQPYLSIDTRTTAKRTFNFPSNKLDALAQYLGLPVKLHTDYQLWVGCEAGDQKSLQYMRKYNIQDIYTLEEVYVQLRPWIKHPNLSLFMNIDEEQKVCPRCGNEDVDPLGDYRTTASVYESYRCNHCGGVWRLKTRKATTAVRVLEASV